MVLAAGQHDHPYHDKHSLMPGNRTQCSHGMMQKGAQAQHAAQVQKLVHATAWQGVQAAAVPHTSSISRRMI
jgi:hypothetical protein